VKKLCLFAVIAALQFNQVQAQLRHVDVVPYYGLDAAGNRTLSVGSYNLSNPNDGSEPVHRNVLLFYGAGVISPVTPPGSLVNGDPGWNRPPDFNSIFEGDGLFGANYPAGTSVVGYGVLAFNVVVDPRLGRNLSYWDGNGTPSFGPVPSDEILDLYFTNPLGPPVPSDLVTLSGEPTGMPGFDITQGPQGERLFPGFHEHTGASLWGSATRDPDDMPSEGWYLYSRVLTVTDDVIDLENGFVDIIFGTQTSPVFHTLLYYDPTPDVIYEYGDILYQYQPDEYGDIQYDDEGNPLLLIGDDGNPVPQLDDEGNPLREVFVRYPALEAAQAWVNTNLQPVPEPATAASLLVAAGITALRIRRKR
jgi:hypothetical protein